MSPTHQTQQMQEQYQRRSQYYASGNSNSQALTPRSEQQRQPTYASNSNSHRYYAQQGQGQFNQGHEQRKGQRQQNGYGLNGQSTHLLSSVLGSPSKGGGGSSLSQLWLMKNCKAHMTANDSHSTHYSPVSQWR